MRSDVTKQPEDVISATNFLFRLRDLPVEVPFIPRHRVTELLVEGLALQVELEAGNVMQNIREIATLSRELLTMETPDIDTTRLIDIIWGFVQSHSKLRPGVPDQPLDELIECVRVAMKCRPDLPQGRAALVMLLISRYYMTNVDDDYEEAMSILDEVTSSGNSHGQETFLGRFQGLATCLAATLAMIRADAHFSPEYTEESMYRTRMFLSSSSHTDLFSKLDLNPEFSAKQRLDYFGSIEGVEEPSEHILDGLVPQTPESVRTKYYEMEPLCLILEGLDDGDTTKIDEIIKKCSSIAASSNTPLIFNKFGEMLHKAFDRTKKIEYLNELISVRRQIINSPESSQARRRQSLPPLSWALLHRFELFPDYRKQDLLDEGLELITKCVNDTRVSLHIRIKLACYYAHFTRSIRHSSVSTAYETALSVMQSALQFSPTLQLQHATLVTDDTFHCLPLDYASYQVDQQQLEEAIKTLERGRAILWSQMRHLRAPVDQLLEVDPDLGHKLTAVNRDLEELTKSVPPSHELNMDGAAADDLRAVDPFGRLLMKQRNLLKERAKLISQIQSLPGFDGFLAPPSFDTIRSAALSGPVIIINHSKWRSDILILLRDLPPSLISTPRDFYDRASALKHKLLDSRRKSGLNSSDYEETLAFVLAQLYELVGKPVIDRLSQLQVPEQSRIWWCPTSVFCFLPLHAMGPIPSDDGETRYFLDLYICSYTLTLDALIQPRKRDSGSRPSGKPSILLVAQPDASLPTVEREIKVVQALDNKVTSLIAEAATPATVIDGFHHHGFVHFACHGALEAGKPFEAGFELHGNARLTLLKIVRAHLPAAEFAFLSACHTAEMTQGSIMDEGLHLAAAVQYCGFRSVVGTMWAMADIDGRDLAKYFYRELFSESRGTPYHEGSAKALQFAVKKLRRKRGVTLERWVNFVHYGA